MTRVIIGEDCGNSPKNLLLQKLTLAFARRDTPFILSRMTDDIRWTVVGVTQLEGKEALAEALAQAKAEKPVALTVAHVLSHGKAGAVDGTLKLKDGTVRAFCDVYEFSGAKGTVVRALTSYVVAAG
jgi:hypothetical protein